MKNAIALVWNREQVVVSVQLISLMSIAVIAPMFQQQLITGSLVNATLFIATGLFGIQAGVLVGLFPSIMALSFGTLPAPLAPMIPFIMMSNVLLVFVFFALSKRHWQGVVVASVVKWAFLFGMSSIMVSFLPNKEMMHQVAIMMSWPQLVTAFLGGVLAFFFLKMCRKIQ